MVLCGRDKDILVRLARSFGMEVMVFGVARKGVFNLGKELFYRQWRLNKVIGKFKPDIMMAVAGTFISILGKVRGIPTYVFYDTEHATVSNLLAYPFATCTYVPRCYRKSIGWRHVRYDGYHELAYLRPEHFQPDFSVLGELGLREGELFTLVRFVNWGAGHDIGMSGLSVENKLLAVKRLGAFSRVFITSEEVLPSELESFRLKLDVTRIHSLVYCAALVFGESATMASEAAVLGVPGIYIDPVGRGYTDELEHRYGMVFNFTHEGQVEAIDRGVSILSDYDRGYWRGIGRRILSEKIDVSEMMYRLVMEHSLSD